MVRVWLFSTLLILRGLLAPGVSQAQAQDSVLIVELLFPGIGSTMILAEVVEGDTLFPVADVMDLCGYEESSTVRVTRETLARMLGPTVDLRFLRDRLLLIIDDPNQSCPALRAKLDAQVAESQARQAAPAVARRSGWGLSLVRDEDGPSQVDAAYNVGRAALFGSWSSEAGLLWSISASPLRKLWFSYSDSELHGPSVSGRYAVGRQWVGLNYEEETDLLSAQAAVVIGPVLFYLAGDTENDLSRTVVTYRGPGGLAVQVGKTFDRLSAGVSLGNMNPTPFHIAPVRRY